MAEYAVVFTVDASSAESSIKNLKKSIKGVTKEFENAEIGAGDFLAAASDLSQLKKELKDASSAVVDIDKAYGDLDKALAAMQKGYEKANKEAVSYHKDTLKIAEDSAKQEDRLLKQKMNAERKAFEERLKMAIAEDRRNERRFSARMEFRSGMGAKDAIPGVASPVRGGAQQFGSPAYFDALNKDLERAINEGRQLDTEIAEAANSRQQAIASFLSGMGAKGAVPRAASSVQGSVQQTGSPAYFDALNKDLKQAIAEGRQIDADIKRAAESREQALAEFRAGMGARGAIPAVASPIRGGIDYGPTKGGNGIPSSPGSPAYLEAIGQATKAAKGIKPDAKAFATNSLAFYENKLKILQKEARLIHPDTNRWKELNKQILQAEKGIRKINQKQSLGASARDRVGAAGGAFLYGGGMGGGVGSAVGGITGGLMGGVPGAFAGAAVGQAVDNLGTALAGITNQAAAIQKIQRGLAMASVDAKDFAEAQAAVGQMSQKLLVPLEQTAKYFTQLRANTKEYNLSVDETRQILEGTVLAIMATGGSAEDLDGAMRAVVQIMSKGGVQAEELRGQLGERFPGAVVKFAQANKLSFEQLQDGLEKGTIGIREFINFAKKNYTDYAKFSEQLATAPEYAGQRLAIALEQVSLEVGSLFGPMGAEIQDGFTAALKGIAKFVKENRVILGQMIRDFGSIIVPILKVFVELLKILGSFAFEVAKVFTSLFEQIKKTVGMASIGAAKVRLDKAKAATAGKTREAPARQESVVDVLTGRTIFKEVKDLFGINSPFEELDAAQRQFNDMGGMAAYAQANKPVGPSNLTYGGTGAGMSIDRAGKEEKKKKEDSLENFERLRDQLANAYNQAEIERIKARYELEKRLREDLYDMQEFGANRLQRQNLQFLRALAKAEQDRQDVAFSGQVSIAGAEGRVAASPSSGAPVPSSGYIDKKVLRDWLVSQGFGRTTGDFTNKGHATPNHTLNAMDMGILGGSDADALRKTTAMERRLKATGAFGSQLFGPERDPYGHGAGKGGQNIHIHIPTPGGKVPMTPGLAGLMNYSGPVSAGAPGKVGSNKSRDTMATASIGIEKENAALADRGALLAKESTVLKDLGRYMQEVYNVPDLTLDNQLLKERNDLMEQGIDESAIDYKMRLFEIDLQYKDLLKALPSFATKANLSTEQRKILEAALVKGLEASKDAEKNKNDEILRGISIQERRKFANEMTMARALTPDEEMRAQIAQEGYIGKEAESKFQERKILEGAQKLKQDMQSIASAIGDSFGNAFKGIITGSMTAQQALAGFFQSIGDSFADMAAKMISEWLKLEAIKGIQSILSMLSPGAALGAADPGGKAIATGQGIFAAANGGIAMGGFHAFAAGGIVKGPTLGLVGEGRYNEAVVPLPDGKSIPVDLSGMGGGAGAISTNIVINVSNGQAQSNTSGGASDLGRKMEGAVKQVLVNELRPGGLLGGGRR